MANVFSMYNSMLSSANKIASMNTPSLIIKDNSIEEGTKVTSNGESFGDLMKEQLNNLNNKQVEADNMIQGFITGEVDDLHSVMIASEEARISLELAVQIRNKCIESYKEITNMQL